MSRPDEPEQDDDTGETSVPPLRTVERLIRWHEKRARSDAGLALNLEAEGLDLAADTNRQRALAHRQTATCLRALRDRCCRPEPEFRGHLTARTKPPAQVRAPP